MDKKKRDKAKTHYLVHKKFSTNENFEKQIVQLGIVRKVFSENEELEVFP